MDNEFERLASGVISRCGTNFVVEHNVEYALIVAKLRVVPKIVLRPGDTVVVMRKKEVPPDEFMD